MALSGDAAQLDPLFAAFLTAVTNAAAADLALQGAVTNVATLRSDAVAAQQAARVAFNDVLRRMGAGSMTAAQRAAWRRIFGDVSDLDPAQLGGAVQRASGG